MREKTAPGSPEYAVVERVCFETSDGNIHRSLYSANKHQLDIERSEKADRVLQDGGSIADALRAAGSTREIDPILEKVNKNTKLVIGYWQCKDNPGYSPMWFGIGCRLMVGGNTGTGSGHYQSYVSIDDLARYAKDSRTEFGA